MGEFVIAIRREHNKETEIYGQAQTENSAVTKADRLYNQLFLDTVAVLEVDVISGLLTTAYKRERTCKHLNIQFTLTMTGVHPVCEGCMSTMIVQEEREI